MSQVEKDENGKPWGIDTPNEEGMTPLMRVIERGNYELIEFLIEAGANLQATDTEGDTPFHYAARLFHDKKKSSKINWLNEKTAPQISKVNFILIRKKKLNMCCSAGLIEFILMKNISLRFKWTLSFFPIYSSTMNWKANTLSRIFAQPLPSSTTSHQKEEFLRRCVT